MDRPRLTKRSGVSRASRGSSRGHPPRGPRLRQALWVAASLALGAGCGPADSSPLGGPYGGTATHSPPTVGSSTTSGDATSQGGPTDAGPGDAGSSGSTGSSGSSGSSGGSSSSGGSGSGSASSSGGSSSGGAAPTWTAIYDAYLAKGTVGNCRSCHSQATSASGTYSWLQTTGYIGGTTSTLVRGGSCLTWFGGNMPPGGRSDPMAVSDMTAWAAAGAPNN
jgi:hypothetical protein